MADVSDRLRALLDAGIALNSELSLDALLQRLVETAAELTGARYAALGVIDKSGQTLERFLTTGIDPETHAAIGELPRGRGILGVLIRESRPLRLDDIAADTRSVGFPRNHPPMKAFLGVPISQRGVAYGNLYLTEKEGGGEFTDEDLELTQLLAAQAAVAIENARLYESTTRWLRQFETLNEIGNALASEVEVTPLLRLVSRRLRELLDARMVLIALPGSGSKLVVAAADGEGTYGLPGMHLDLDHSKMGRVLERSRSERVDSVLEDPEVDQQAARRLGIHTGLYVPLLIGGQPIGVVVAHDRGGPDPRFTDDDLRLAETLATRAATGVDLSQRVSRDAVRRVVEAQELERKRLARELHDETGQALTSILLGLKPLEEATDGETRDAVLAVRELVVSTLQDVRRLAVELRPSALDDLGLVPAVDRLARSFAESGVVVDVEAQIGDDRLPEEVETTLYRIVQEAVTNVAKHAEPDIETVGEAANADRAVFEAMEHKPDVVLMDVTMPGVSGVESLPTLLQSVPDTSVLMLSMHDDPGYVRAAFDAGASGYVLKEAADAEVVAAVRAVAMGERYVHPALGARMVAAEADERKRAETDPLSEREQEVLRLLALGHTNQEIAGMLYISVRTAETHRAHIMQKLRLGSRAELVRYALDAGLIEP